MFDCVCVCVCVCACACVCVREREKQHDLSAKFCNQKVLRLMFCDCLLFP